MINAINQCIFVKFLIDAPFAFDDDCACYIESMTSFYIYINDKCAIHVRVSSLMADV